MTLAQAEVIETAQKAASDALNASRQVSELAYFVMAFGLLLIVGFAVMTWVTRTKGEHPFQSMLTNVFEQLVSTSNRMAEVNEQNSKRLELHTDTLEQQNETLKQQNDTIQQQGQVLENVSQKVDKIAGSVFGIQENED